MFRNRWLGVGMLTLALGLTAPAAAQESALAVVPADAPLVVQIHGVQRTKDRILALIKNAVPDLAPMVQAKLDEAMTKGLEGRDLKGLAKDGPIFLALTEMPKQGGLPAMAVIVKVTTFKEFRDSILTEEERKGLKTEGGLDLAMIKGQEYYLVDHKGYAVITPQKEEPLTVRHPAARKPSRRHSPR